MASSDVQRKLTAILMADVAGYSRLMGADEEATVDAIPCPVLHMGGPSGCWLVGLRPPSLTLPGERI